MTNKLKPKRVYKPKVTGNWKPKFLRNLQKHGNVSRSCLLSNVSTDCVYKTRAADPVFAKAWNEALTKAVDALEETAHRRAHTTSDTLLIFLLKANRPEKYRETTKLEHSGKLDGQTNVIVYIPDDGRNPVIEQPTTAQLPAPDDSNPENP